MVVTVNPGATGSITNTVTVTGNQSDPNLSNNTSTVTTQVIQSADLALVKTASPNPVKAGQQLTYTLTATNNGPSNATGVSIVDTLPASTAYYSASGQSSATIVDQTLTLNIGNLAVGASSTITVVVAVASTATGTITNTATVSGNQSDPNLANNTASVSTQVDVLRSFNRPSTDLKIVKTAKPNPVTVGADLTYTLVVTNKSLTTATDVTIVDTLPAGFDLSLGQRPEFGDDLRQHAHFLPGHPGSSTATDTITLVGVVTSAAASTITNTATVSSDLPESIPADATSSVTTAVVRPSQPSKFYYDSALTCLFPGYVRQ